MQVERFEVFSGVASQINKELQRLKKTEMARFGLRGTDAMCVICLGKYPTGLPSADIARSIGVDRALVSRSVGMLQRAGYVEVLVGNGKSAYRSPVVLTAKGVALEKEIDSVVNRLVNQVTKDLPADEITVMYRVLGKILENIKAL